MSAEILHRTAAKIREDLVVMADETGAEPDDFLPAIADLLGNMACEADDLDEFDGFDPNLALPGYPYAVLVARAYLGADQ